MTWHYQAFKHVQGKDVYYTVGEIYSSGGYIEKVKPIGNTKKELIKDLEYMLKDVKKYPPKKA